jgi:hypothetical protein
MKKVKSNLPLDYVTLKTTKSRIDKGLLAIPVSLIDIFPKDSNNIFIVDENGKTESKTFTPYKSSSRECRIGGLKSFYEKYRIYDGEELVIQILDDSKFRILPERLFKSLLLNRIFDFEQSINEDETENNLSRIS